MPDRHWRLQTAGGASLRMPSTGGVDLQPGMAFIWPVGQRLGSLRMRQATVQPLTRWSDADGSVTWVRIDADKARGTIDYHLSRDRDALTPRIMARVIPGDRVGASPESSVLTMVAWRVKGMSDERWGRLVASHEFEVYLIKSLIETS